MKIKELIENLKSISQVLHTVEAHYDEPTLIDVKPLAQRKAKLEAALSGQKVPAVDMLEQLEASTGKRWRIVPYANTANMVEGVEEVPPFFDTYCEPRGGIIFASEKSEYFDDEFVMLDEKSPALDKGENIMLECGKYHIRYAKRDETIKDNITYDTMIVDLLRRDDSVIGSYSAREKTNVIDAFDGTVDLRITAYAERVLEENLKDVDIDVDSVDPNSTRRKK